MTGALALRGGGRRVVLAVVAVLAVASTAFLVVSSFVLSDGRRYFSLADDAMISMRYAWNLAHGDGLVWNPGERVEGYTNPLLTLAMAAIAWAVDEKRIAVLLVQVLGAVAVVGVAQVVSASTQEISRDRPWGERRWLVLTAFAWVCLHFPFVGWALSGGELTLQALCLAGLGVVAERADKTSTLSYAAAGALGALAYLVRPDTLVGVFVFWLLWLSRTGASVSRLLLAVAPVAVTVVAHLIFRRLYYDAWLPNTYTLKVTGIPIDVRLRNGLVYTIPYLIKVLPLFGLAALGVARQRGPASAWLVMVLPALAAYQIWVGGDAFPGWRLLIPGLLVMLPACMLGLAELAALLGRSWPARASTRMGVVTLAASVYWLLMPELGERHRTDLFTKGYYGSEPPPALDDLYPDDDVTFAAHNRTNVQTALALGELLGPGARIGVFWAGAIPYYTDHAAVDFLGKSDPAVARLPPDLERAPTWFGMSTIPGHNKYDLHRSIGAGRLDYLQHDRYGRDDLRAELGADYEWVRHQGVWLLLRRNSPHVAWSRINEKVSRREAARRGAPR